MTTSAAPPEEPTPEEIAGELITSSGSVEGMDRRIDLFGSLVVTGFGLLVFLGAAALPPPRVVFDAVGPAGLPMVIGVTLAIAGAVQSIRTIRLMRETGVTGYPEGTADEPDHPSSTIRALGFIVGSFVYIASLPTLGYLVATPIAISLGLGALGYGSLPRIVATAAGYTLIAFIVFDRFLSVPLPLGILNDLLVELDIVERVR